MKNIKFNPSGVCCKEMEIVLNDDDTIEDVVFVGGCPGNTLGITSLVKGEKALDVADRLQGITCGGKNTSCPDQLSSALRGAVK
ncbi:MAG: TIGR03905 family TSCPD domain-containing protein [Peptostreptococcus sp.]|uniref:TIGR03905 family TSCPD domain-containing protein n=1 Tax=Peptostreptococcus sp. TaxID=1262 RepID=UPI002FC5F7F0